MFSKRRPVLFISKNYIETGWVTLSKELLFEGDETRTYSLDTLPEHLRRIQASTRESLRIVLSEELVYVTTLSFPSSVRINRKRVEELAETSIPENLQQTLWDFRTMRYKEHSKRAGEILVQVAVIEQGFARVLDHAIQSGMCQVDAVLPESSILALFEESYDGMTLIVAEDRESTVIVGVSCGLVMGTVVKQGVLVESTAIESAVHFLEDISSERISRIIGSRLSNQDILAVFEKQGYLIEIRDYNPLLGVFLVKTRGSDEQVLNLISDTNSVTSWWCRLMKR